MASDTSKILNNLSGEYFMHRNIPLYLHRTTYNSHVWK